MKIIRDEKLATLTFVPTEVAEEVVIASIITTIKPGDELDYGGRGRDGDDDTFVTVRLHAGGHMEDKKEVKGNVTICRSVHVGGVELVLRGTTEEDKREVNRIRDMCFFASGGLIFVGETEVDGKKAIITIGLRCKHCGAGLIRHSDSEWKTCDACAEKCEHNYVRGAVHGGTAGDIGIGEFCDKCGRCKPLAVGEREISQLEHHLAVQKELGVHIIYKNGPPTTPHEVVEAKRLIRRYEKVQQRGVSA